ncbi:ISL3 family transposase [bacterium]|nr:ISL3 family transposase [bacterium]
MIKAQEGKLQIELAARRNCRLPCGQCGTLSRVRDRLKERQWRHVPLWGIPSEIRYRPARVRCPKCQAVKVEAMPWSYGKSRLSVGFIWLLAAWAKLLAWKVAADQFGVHWNSVQGAVRQAVDYGLTHRDLGSILCIGIDELSRKKGHVYVTNVYDLEERRLIWSGEGRSQDTLKEFFEEHGEALKDKVIGVCCDMWQPYIDMIEERLPNATLIFDKFHIIQHLNKAVDEVRRDEARELKKENPELLQKTRYIWLKNPENLTDKQRARLGHLEKLNLRTNRAYLLKEGFREFWTYWSKGWAKKFLNKWFWWATHSRLKPLRDFAWMLRRHQEGLLNYFELRIDNGTVEGMNNKAKVISHRCYGFRTAKTYILALYHGLGNLPEPKLVHKFL